MRQIRLGYVGCGFMAQKVHLPNFASLPDARLVALAETRPRLAQQVATRFGIPRVYASHEELALDPEVEAVGVSAGFAIQGEIAEHLLRAGKHVFMEKPMAISVAQAERMLEAARAGSARLFVAYMKRYDPGNVLARDTIARWKAGGAMGRVLYARAHGFCGNWLAGLESTAITTDEALPPAPYDRELPAWLPAGQAQAYVDYLQQYTHNLNLLRYLLGSGDRASVRMVDLDPDGFTGIVSVELDGVRSTMESGSSNFHAWDEHTQVYFENGWVHVWAPPLMARSAESRVEIYEGGALRRYTYPVPEPTGTWAYREEAKYFLQALRSGEPFPSSGEDTLTDVRLYEEIYRAHLGISAEESRTVGVAS